MKLFKLFKSLWRYLKEDKIKLIIFIISTALLSFQILIYPFLWGKALNSLLLDNFDSFFFYLILSSSISLIMRLLVELPHDYLHNILELNFMGKVSKDLYRKVLNLPARAFEEHGVGELINRIYTDPDKIIELLSRLIRLISRFITAIFIIIFVISISWILFLEIFILMVVVFALSRYFHPRIKKTQENIKNNQDKYIKETNQSLSGIREIKALGIKGIIKGFTFDNIDNLFNEQRKSKFFEMSYYHTIWFFYLIMEFLILGTCGYFFVNDAITFEIIIMIEVYLYRIYDVVDSFSEFGVNYQKITVSLTRISEIVDNKLYEDERFGDKKLENPKGIIEFKDVYFGYDANSPILKGLNLKIDTNKKIAIVGKSGMGKSTVFNLLARFFDVNSGKITIDGTDISELDEHSLRKNISIIRQEPYIFNRTIKQNFEMVREKVSFEKIQELCKKAYIHDYIMSLPEQYDTLIGEGGVNLSGGQKQRLAIARALEKDSKIILFDEATSALDNESQSYIKKTIDDLSKDHTVVIIAHRLSTIMDADEIVLIDEGKVLINGDHNYLINNNELYAKLYSSELVE